MHWHHFLYRIVRQWLHCSLKYSLIEYEGTSFIPVTQNQDETYFHDLGHRGLRPAFDRGSFGGRFKNPYPHAWWTFKGFHGFNRIGNGLTLNWFDVIWVLLGFSLSVEASICIELNLGKLSKTLRVSHWMFFLRFVYLPATKNQGLDNEKLSKAKKVISL